MNAIFYADTSGVYETNGEVGGIYDCTLLTEMGAYTNGESHVTEAANNNPKESDVFEGNGGNETFHCKFSADDFEPAL